METNCLLVLLVGLLHLSLAFPHGADHAEDCTIDERVSFVIKSGTSEGDFTPEVIPLNNTRLEVVGEPRGNVVEEVRNGVKYSIIKTSVTVVISPPPTTSSPATTPTTEETTTTSSSDPEDLGEFITINGHGSYKFHKSAPIENMREICAKEEAVVAYPLYLEEVEEIVKTLNISETLLAVGIKWNETGMYNFEHDTAYVSELLWDSAEPPNLQNCSALNLTSERMKNISCNQELPFLCKKDDGYEKGYGFYTYQGPDYISEMEATCKKKNRTVAVPQSPEEAKVMVSHALNDDRYLSVGLRKVMNDTREQYMRVGVKEQVNENEFESAYVNISSDLWEEGAVQSGYCIVLRRKSEQLIFNRCDDVKYPFLCKKDLTPPRSVFLSDKSITYQYQPWYKKTSEVTALCKAQGFTSVAFPKERTFDKEALEIARLIPDDEPYIAIGIERRNTSAGTYEALGLKRSYDYNSSDFWEGGAPKYDGDCIKFSKESRKFVDFDCGEPLPYICVKYGH